MVYCRSVLSCSLPSCAAGVSTVVMFGSPHSILATFTTASPRSLLWQERRYGGSISLYVSSGVGGERLSHPSTTSILQVPHAPSPPQTWLTRTSMSPAQERSVLPVGNSAAFPWSANVTRGIGGRFYGTVR